MSHDQLETIFATWYDDNSRSYEDLARSISVALDSLLKDSSIEFVSINHRLKEKSSCLRKLGRKDYQRPEEMTDVAALRVITYLQSDVDLVSEIISKEFRIFEQDSVDKNKALGVDKVGYRSKHHVVSLSSVRLKLKENARFRGMKVEVQVRTVLQHAWAEIEHDRNFKFGGKLPDALKRRLNLVAGMLEIADLEFEEITSEIKKYQRKVSEKTNKGQLDVEVNSLSVGEFLMKKGLFDNVRIQNPGKVRPIHAAVIAELESFCIMSLSDVESIISEEFVAAASGRPAPTAAGFLRRAMLFSDPSRFFSKSQFRDFKALTPGTFSLLVAKVGEPRARRLVRSAGLRLLPGDSDIEVKSGSRSSSKVAMRAASK